MDVIKALIEHSEAGAAIVEALYGEDIEISKLLTAKEKKAHKERVLEKVKASTKLKGLEKPIKGKFREVKKSGGAVLGQGHDAGTRKKERGLAAAALGGTAVATVGGGHAMYMAGKELREKAHAVKHPVPLPRRELIEAGAKIRKIPKGKIAAGIAAGWIGLHGVELAADGINARAQTRAYRNNMEPKVGLKKSAGDVEFYGEISKVDTDKRQVFGWASVTAINGVPVEDLQDDSIDLVEIEKAAYRYVVESRKGGNMHGRTDEGVAKSVSDMIESFVVTPEKRESMGLPSNVPDGWWVGFQVNDDHTWEEAKAGRLVGFSIHGTGRRTNA